MQLSSHIINIFATGTMYRNRKYILPPAPRLAARLFFFLFSVFYLLLPGNASASDEYETKAKFIYNFAHYMEWKGETGVKNVKICIIGRDPFGQKIDALEAMSDDKVKYSISRNVNSGNIKSCKMIFVSASAEERMREVVSLVSGNPTITISDIEGFAKRGGIVEFIIVNNRIRLIVNLKAAIQSGIKINPELLEIAQEVIR